MRPLTSDWDADSYDGRSGGQDNLPAGPLRRRPSSRLAFAVRALAFALVCVMAAGAYLAIVSGGDGQRRVLVSTHDRLQELIVAAGFGINQIAITGTKFASDTAIFDALGVRARTSLLSFDAAAARARIEALPWIASARLSRDFPDGLRVDVRERVAFAIWRNGETRTLIDRNGHTLSQIVAGYDIGLPVVAGQGAPRAAGALLAALKTHPDLLKETRQAMLVGKRRWTLHLQTGVEIYLPEKNVKEALDRLGALRAREQILQRDILAVDLRSRVRTTVRRTTAAPAGKAASVRRRTGRRT